MVLPQCSSTAAAGPYYGFFGLGGNREKLLLWFLRAGVTHRPRWHVCRGVVPTITTGSYPIFPLLFFVSGPSHPLSNSNSCYERPSDKNMWGLKSARFRKRHGSFHLLPVPLCHQPSTHQSHPWGERNLWDFLDIHGPWWLACSSEWIHVESKRSSWKFTL